MAATRKKVLWVDDEIEFLRSHIMFLETRGYSVIPVFSGDDAIQILHENPKGFDIVLLDEQMPGKDGLTTLEEIKEFQPDLPVVMVTKSEEEQVMEDALGKKIDGYLTKPVNPSQILLICKRILDSKRIISSQITQRFIRKYSENRTCLANRLNAQEWIRMYENMAKWDMELERVEDEGLRQTHAGQKSDCNSIFSDYVMENYARWIKGQGEPPLFSVDVLEKHVCPHLRDGKQVYLIVLSGMRLDQYMGIELILKKHFDVKRDYFYSILPTTTSFARNALLGGNYPLEIATRHPELWTTGDEDESVACRLEQQLLEEKLKSLGIDLRDPGLWYTRISDAANPQSIVEEINQHRNNPMVTMVVNFVDMLTTSRSTSALLQEIAPDESAFRSLTQSWFQHSALLQVLKELAQQDCTIVLTADHGSTFCSRGTEIYGIQEMGANLRCKFGEKITSDERRVVYLADPAHYGLPSFTPTTSCIIAKENYYFIHPEKFEYYQKQYQNSFQQGGISLEEIIVPLGTLTPL